MTLVWQPEGSNLCGQAAVAMLTGMTLEQSIAAFGKKGCTTTKQVRAVLADNGIRMAEKAVRWKSADDLPELALCIVHWRGSKRTHWTVWNRDVFYDSGGGLIAPDGYDRFGGYVTSYFEIKLPE